MQGRTALVTGASYGVGAATALALAREGFDLAVSATRAENLDVTMAKLAATGERAARRHRQHRLDPRAHWRRRALDLRHLERRPDPDDADAGDRMGGARHPRQCDRARPTRYAVAHARRAHRRSRLYASDALAHS